MLTDCVTTTPKSEVRCTLVVTLLLLLAALLSTTELDEMFALSFRLLLDNAPNAALGKLPAMAMVPLLPFVRESPLQPVAVQAVAERLPPKVTPLCTKPRGKVFAIVTLVASFGPVLVTVKV